MFLVERIHIMRKLHSFIVFPMCALLSLHSSGSFAMDGLMGEEEKADSPRSVPTGTLTENQAKKVLGYARSFFSFSALPITIDPDITKLQYQRIIFSYSKDALTVIFPKDLSYSCIIGDLNRKEKSQGNESIENPAAFNLFGSAGTIEIDKNLDHVRLVLVRGVLPNVIKWQFSTPSGSNAKE